MKKAVISLLVGSVAALLLLLSSCHSEPKESSLPNSSSSQVSTVQSSASGSGNNAQVSVPESGTEWPAQLVGDVPKPQYDTVKYEIGKKGSEFEGLVEIELTGVPDGDQYIQKLESLGYESLTNMKIGNSVTFIGNKEDKSAHVQIEYNYNTKACSIIYGKGL